MKILFVCTDNYTRSVTAELCLRHFLRKNNIKGIKVFSAGIQADSDTSKYYRDHFDRMKELGIGTIDFERTQFVKDFFKTYDLIVAMGKEHKDYFLSEYNREIPLFSEVSQDEEKSIDIAKPGSDHDVKKQLRQMVDYINNAMPQFVENIKKNLFSN